MGRKIISLYITLYISFFKLHNYIQNDNDEVIKDISKPYLTTIMTAYKIIPKH